MSTESSPHVQSNDAPQVSRWRRADRRRHGRDAAGVARADRHLEIQSTWPTKDIFHEFAVDYAKKVNDMTGGRLKLDVLAAGAVVPAFQMSDAVHVRHSRWRPRRLRLLVRQAQGLFAVRHAAVVRLGRARACSAWFYAGGGEALYKELVNDILKLNLVGFLYFPMPTQPLGWFKKEIKSRRRLQGHEVPHRRSLGRRVQGDGRVRHHPAGRRNRAGDGPRPARRGRVQQSVVRHPARLPGRRRSST